MPANVAVFHHGDPVMVDYTPGADVAQGDVVVIGSVARVTHVPLPANRLGAVADGGAVYLVAADAAISAGKKVYWNAAAGQVTETAGANVVFGRTVGASTVAGQVIAVRHAPGA